MAEVIRYVDPDATGSGDGTSWTDAYTSLNAWEAAEETDLVTDGDWHHVYCRSSSGTADTTAVTVDGWTTDSTHYIQIEVAEADRHDGKWDTSAYRLETNNATALDVNEQWTYIYGLQIHVARTDHWYNGIDFGSVNNVKVAYNIIKLTGGNYIGAGIYFSATNYTVYIWNNIIYSDSTYSHDDNSGMALKGGTLSNSHYIYNNTVYGFNYCYKGTGTAPTLVFKNNIGQNAATADFSIADVTTGSEYNISSDTTAVGTNSKTSTTVSFVSTTLGSEDFHLQSTDTAAKDSGTDLSSDSNLSFDDDIDGDTRSGTWDIGADEYVSSGTSVALDGQSDGQSSNSADLTIIRGLNGQANGQAGLTSSLMIIRGLAGQSTTQSSNGADLSITRQLQGQADGISSNSADIGLIRGLTGQSDGVSTCTGALSTGAKVSLQGQASGVSATTGDITITRGLSGQSDGVSTASGDLSISGHISLQGQSDGVSGLVGDISITRQISGQSMGVLTTSGLLGIRLNIAGIVNAVSGATATLTVLSPTGVIITYNIISEAWRVINLNSPADRDINLISEAQ